MAVPPIPPPSRSAPPFWAVVAFAFLVRAAFAALVLWPVSWTDHGIDHGSEIGQIARNVFEGRGFSSPFGVGSAPTAWLAPLVPALWVLVFAAVGLFSQASIVVLIGLQMLAGALACGLYVEIARRVLERMGAGASRLPWLVAALVCLWPESLDRQTHMWYFPFQELGLAWMFLVGMAWIAAPERRRSLHLGAAAGILGLVNPGPLPVFAAILVLGSFAHRRTPRRVLSAAALAAGVCALFLAPWTLRNLAVLGSPIPMRSNVGVELLVGNGARGAVAQRRDAQHPAVDPIERRRYETLGEVAYMRAARAEALEHIRGDPGRFARRTLERVATYWAGDVLDRWTWAPRPPWWKAGPRAIARRLLKLACILGPSLLVALGLARGLGRRVPGLALFLGVLVLLPLPYYVTHVHEAYSYAVRPYVLLLAVLLLAAHRLGPRTAPLPVPVPSS